MSDEFFPLCSRLIQQNVKLDDANFVEQRLCSPERVAVHLAPVGAVAPLGPAPPIRQRLNDGLAERVLTRVRLPAASR